MTPRQIVLAIEYKALRKALKRAKISENRDAIQAEVVRIAAEYAGVQVNVGTQPPPPPPPPPPPDF